MHCNNCGSALSQPTGFCGTCGQPITPNPPPAWPPYSYDVPGRGAAPSYATDVTTQFTVPADLYAAPPPPQPGFHGLAAQTFNTPEPSQPGLHRQATQEPSPQYNPPSYYGPPPPVGAGNPHSELHLQAYGEVPVYYETNYETSYETDARVPSELPVIKLAIGAAVIVVLAILALISLLG